MRTASACCLRRGNHSGLLRGLLPWFLDELDVRLLIRAVDPWWSSWSWQAQCPLASASACSQELWKRGQTWELRIKCALLRRYYRFLAGTDSQNAVDAWPEAMNALSMYGCVRVNLPSQLGISMCIDHLKRFALLTGINSIKIRYARLNAWTRFIDMNSNTCLLQCLAMANYMHTWAYTKT